MLQRQQPTWRAILAKLGRGATMRSVRQLRNISDMPPVTTPTACAAHATKEGAPIDPNNNKRFTE